MLERLAKILLICCGTFLVIGIIYMVVNAG
ncbi:hypothetical protein HNP81_001097 [Peribacillus huizhouensis]|uniref:Uncharacterized protein n=1 Tax=Peribacillus huizhouensis TaxID=1501239 RepID=A0ABR6CL95_9BACI|nr:hypothetical protein [Peribacillus huizhouensis]